MSKAFIVLNPIAGHAEPDIARRAFKQYLESANWAYEVYETTGKECVADIVSAALKRDFDLVVAAGGDGTVSSVADALVRTGILLGIVPIGTGNALAYDLGIPADLDEALRLLVGEHTTKRVDAMRIGDRYAILNVSVGVGSLTMRDTNYSSKRRFGVVAYLLTGLEKLLGFQPCRFTLSIDGQRKQVRASEVVVANSGSLGQVGLVLGHQIRTNDGHLDVCVVRARTIFGYLSLLSSVMLGQTRRDPHIRCFSGVQGIAADAQESLPVQADGEIVGQTPVRVEVVPGAVTVIVPEAEHAPSYLRQ
ncbi:MAG: diacylglycerol kinase family lipid kinase [Anaerolineae bacterium]|nr:diacylglycerol kinase family lipid kinase [Anaerolineae bacterium]